MCWYWQPPQRPKCGHGAGTRSGEGSTTCSNRPRMNFFLRVDGFNSNEFAGKNQRHENRVAVVMPQAVAAIHQFFNSNFHSESLSVAGGCDPRPGASGQVEQTQARKIIALPEPFLHVLPLELRELRGSSSFCGTERVARPCRGGRRAENLPARQRSAPRLVFLRPRSAAAPGLRDPARLENPPASIDPRAARAFLPYAPPVPAVRRARTLTPRRIVRYFGQRNARNSSRENVSSAFDSFAVLGPVPAAVSFSSSAASRTASMQ